MDDDEKMEKMMEIINNLPDIDRRLLLMDMDNDFEGKNYLLSKEYGIIKKGNREYYIKTLKEKVKQMVEGTYKERKSKFDKFKK